MFGNLSFLFVLISNIVMLLFFLKVSIYKELNLMTLNRLIISNIFGNTEDWQCFFSWILVQVSWNTHVPEPWMLHVSLNLPLCSGFPHVGYTCLCLYFRTICISIILVNHLYYIINCISLKFHSFQSNLCPLFNIFKDPFFSLLLFNLHIWVIQLLVGNTQMSTSPC